MAYTGHDPVLLAKTLTTFAKTAPALKIKAAVVPGRAIKPAEVADLAALPGKAELLREAALPAASPDGAAGERAGRRPGRRIFVAEYWRHTEGEGVIVSGVT